MILLFSPFAIAQDADLDNDGLSKSQEDILGTLATNPDSDGDGLTDGDEYFRFFTDPTQADTDRDGINDAQDSFPTWLNYNDLSGVTTSTDRILNDQSEQLRLNQLVRVAVGNVITIDWFNQLTEQFTMGGAEFTISFDFIDPNQTDFSEPGFYQVNTEGDSVHVRLPASREIVDETIDWRGNTMTISDWPYHVFSQPLAVGQKYELNVFYHEFLAQGEAPYFNARIEVVDRTSIPLDTRLGRQEFEVYIIEAVLMHETFNDPFFKNFLGENPAFRTLVQITTDQHVMLRYTTPFFRITPSKSVGFSDFIINH